MTSEVRTVAVKPACSANNNLAAGSGVTVS